MVKFLVDGESPVFGKFKKDEKRGLPAKIEKVLIERGIAVESSITKTKSEVKNNG